jgi:hypothetical protein
MQGRSKSIAIRASLLSRRRCYDLREPGSVFSSEALVEAAVTAGRRSPSLNAGLVAENIPRFAVPTTERSAGDRIISESNGTELLSPNEMETKAGNALLLKLA